MGHGILKPASELKGTVVEVEYLPVQQAAHGAAIIQVSSVTILE